MNFQDMRLAAARRQPAVKKYTQGMCGEFAVALAIITHLPVVVFCDAGTWPLHALVETPHGTFIDVRGEQNWDEVQLEWDWARSYKCFTRRASWRRDKQVVGKDGRVRLDGDWPIEVAEVAVASKYIQRYRSRYCVHSGRASAATQHELPTGLIDIGALP